jgi:hypothetical protein
MSAYASESGAKADIEALSIWPNRTQVVGTSEVNGLTLHASAEAAKMLDLWQSLHGLSHG